jgi:hypothetical protein
LKDAGEEEVREEYVVKAARLRWAVPAPIEVAKLCTAQ